MLDLHAEPVENFMRAHPACKVFQHGPSWKTHASTNQADEELEPANNSAK